MRALCINLQQDHSDAIADHFLAFSTRLKLRSPGLLFADVTESIDHFGNEELFLKELNHFNSEFFPSAKSTIASSPLLAQIFNHSQNDNFCCPPETETEIFRELPLSEIHNLEGLVAWSSQEEVEDIITFFKVLGFEKIGDIQSFDVVSFQQRWGKTGELLWKRLHGYEKQLITPIKNKSSYVDNLELSFPISLRPYLLHTLENHCRKLINSIKSDDCEANKLVVYLHCEFNYNVHMIEILPREPYLNLVYIYEELEKKLCRLELSNPIRKIDIEMFASRPQKGKYFSWHKKQVKDLALKRNRLDRFDQVADGQISPKSFSQYDQDWLAIDDLEDSPHSVLVDGLQLELSLFDSESPSTKAQILPYDSGEEVINIKNFKPLSAPEQLLYGFGDHSSERGLNYFLALDSKKNKVCICYDQIEQKYYLKGRLV